MPPAPRPGKILEAGNVPIAATACLDPPDTGPRQVIADEGDVVGADALEKIDARARRARMIHVQAEVQSGRSKAITSWVNVSPVTSSCSPPDSTSTDMCPGV